MFAKCDFKTLELNDGSNLLGLVKINEAILKEGEFVLPILRDESAKLIVRVGKRDYKKSDEFIIASLNDYYNRMNATNESERDVMLVNYNRLYQIWTALNETKKSKDYKTLDEQYDSLSYQLYLLGYKMNE